MILNHYNKYNKYLSIQYNISSVDSHTQWMDGSTTNCIRWNIFILMTANYFENFMALRLLLSPTANRKLFQAKSLHTCEFILRFYLKVHREGT